MIEKDEGKRDREGEVSEPGIVFQFHCALTSIAFLFFYFS